MDWFQKWKLKVNAQKSVAVMFNRRQTSIPATTRLLWLWHNLRPICIRQDHQPCQLHLWHPQLHGNTVPGVRRFTDDYGVIKLRAANSEEPHRRCCHFLYNQGQTCNRRLVLQFSHGPRQDSQKCTDLHKKYINK